MSAGTQQIFVHWALPTTKLLKYAVMGTIAHEALNIFVREPQIDAHLIMFVRCKVWY